MNKNIPFILNLFFKNVIMACYFQEEMDCTGPSPKAIFSLPGSQMQGPVASLSLARPGMLQQVRIKSVPEPLKLAQNGGLQGATLVIFMLEKPIQ